MTEYVKLEDLEDRRVYRIHARNFQQGVWHADREGFIGVREKLGSVYLFTEHFWGETTGTARPIEALNAVVPDEILLADGLPGSWCQTCETEVEYDESKREAALASLRDPALTRVHAWYHLNGTDNHVARPYGRANTDLFHFMANLLPEGAFRTYALACSEDPYDGSEAQQKRHHKRFEAYRKGW